MDIISSKQNNLRVRYIKSLQTKPRFRRRERKLILEGDRLIADALASRGKPDTRLVPAGTSPTMKSSLSCRVLAARCSQ